MTIEIDEDALDQLQMLRDLRLEVAQRQLEGVNGTLEQMKTRGLLNSSLRDNEQVFMMKRLLEEKVAQLKKIRDESNVVHADELVFYSQMLEDDSYD